MHRTARDLIAAVALSAAAASGFAQDAAIRVVALDGDDVGGEELTVYAARDTLALSASGAVLFDGRTDLGTTLLRHDGSESSRIVLIGEDALLPGYTVGSLEGSSLGATGHVGFAPYLTGSSNAESRATWIDGRRDVIARAPGTFRDLQLGGWGFNGESYVFQATVEGPREAPRFDTDKDGIWRSFGAAAAVPLLQLDDGVPGVTGRVVSAISSAPIVHESGAAAFTVSLSGESGALAALVRFPFAGSAAEPEAVVTFGSDDRIRDFTFGSLADDADFPAIGYIISTAGDTSVVDGAGTVVMRTGDVDGERALLLDSRSRMALCDDGQVVVMAHYTSASGNGEGLWRFVPDRGLSLELYTGQMIADADGELRAISDIWNVHVNEQGRVAAEIDLAFFGSTQAIVMQEVPAGEHAVAIQMRESFAADRDTYRVVSIVGQRPNSFTFTGPGHDGAQSRFAPDGAFVFKARVDTESDSTDRSGVFVIGGVPKETCDVTVKVKGKNLIVEGENGDCDLTIAVLDGGDYIVRPGADTTVNGKQGELEISAPGDVRISMGAGKDRLQIVSGYGGSDYGELPRNVTIDMGPDDDYLLMDFLEIKGSLKVRMGKDRGALETVRIDGVGVGKHLQVLCGPTRTVCELEGVVVAYKTKVQHGGDFGYVSSEACQFLGTTQFLGSSSVDVFSFRRCILEGPTSVDLRDGGVGQAKFFDCEGDGASLSLDGRSENAPIFRLEDCDFQKGDVRIATGKSSADIDFVGTIVDDGVDIRTGGSTEGGPVNEISFANSFTYGRLAIRGKGSHHIFAGANARASEGVDVRLKKGGFDSVSISNDFDVDTGGIRVQSNATDGTLIRMDGIAVAAGRVYVKTAGGEDNVLVLNADVGDDVIVKLGDGVDKLTLSGLTGSAGVQADGGPGNDTLLDAGLDPENLDGAIETKNFEQ